MPGTPENRRGAAPGEGDHSGNRAGGNSGNSANLRNLDEMGVGAASRCLARTAQTCGNHLSLWREEEDDRSIPTDRHVI